MRREAIATLNAAGIKVGQAFETLSPTQVEAIRAEGIAMLQRKIRGKVVITADFVRKRYDLLQSRAAVKAGE